jgi:hypothetical protein
MMRLRVDERAVTLLVYLVLCLPEELLVVGDLQ